MFDVITFGAATRDVFLRSKAMELHREHGVMEACFVFGAKLNVEEIIFETGGGGTNNAVTFARMAKLKTAAVCKVGNDSSGDDILSALKKDRVDTAFVQRDAKEKTGYSTIILSREAERTILVHRGAASRLDAEKIPWNKITAKLFHVSSLGGDLALVRKIMDRAEEIGAKVCWNPGNGEFKRGTSSLAPLLRRADLVSINREEASTLTGQKDADLPGIIREMRRLCRHAVVTDGRKGAYAISRERTIHAAVVPVRRINLTGAGDAFTSAYAFAFTTYHDPKTALALGTLNATGVVQNMGAKAGILRHMPTREELAKVKTKEMKF